MIGFLQHAGNRREMHFDAGAVGRGADDGNASMTLVGVVRLTLDIHRQLK